MGFWSHVMPGYDAGLERDLVLARSEYQRDILRGNESLSGSTLRGKAKRYSGSYARSRDSILRRIESPWTEIRAKSGRRILVIGSVDGEELGPWWPINLAEEHRLSVRKGEEQ